MPSKIFTGGTNKKTQEKEKNRIESAAQRKTKKLSSFDRFNTDKSESKSKFKSSECNFPFKNRHQRFLWDFQPKVKSASNISTLSIGKMK